MAWQFSSDRPIYLQIVDHIVLEILGNSYSPGDKLPSVRELASLAAVNPNTMQRAFAELESLGLVATQRNAGRFVTTDLNAINRAKATMAQDLTKEYLRKIRAIGYSREEASGMLKCFEEGAV